MGMALWDEDTAQKEGKSFNSTAPEGLGAAARQQQPLHLCRSGHDRGVRRPRRQQRAAAAGSWPAIRRRQYVRQLGCCSIVLFMGV